MRSCHLPIDRPVIRSSFLFWASPLLVTAHHANLADCAEHCLFLVIQSVSNTAHAFLGPPQLRHLQLVGIHESCESCPCGVDQGCRPSAPRRKLSQNR
ncbi:hypothetical protein BKA66DRAFT_160663 [Pyrenochaeta sp. MPI-SDFR-AT-0127]|nr:hypothetical protein BKA66DRAFT_160663 [Pyrenochaeta sp. MPI-SDFR-AT-0127]